MKVTILGSGTSVPLADRASPSVAIFIDSRFILMDIGPGAIRQLAIAGLEYQDIDYILISHFHPDHTADLIHFFFATRYPAHSDETVHSFRRIPSTCSDDNRPVILK